MFSAPIVATDEPDVTPYYGVYLPVCNRGPGALKGQVQVTGNKQEIQYQMSGFTAPAGSCYGTGICQVRKKRVHPVYLRVNWQRGTEFGVSDFVIGPKEGGVTSVPPKRDAALL